MITLVNGRGQMGEKLKEYLLKSPINTEKETYIYHTWNVENKSEEAQVEEFNKFKSFVDKNYKHKIVFVSTSSEKDTAYVYYKQISEAYLINKAECSIILRFPLLIGRRGTLSKLKNKEANAFGLMELIPINEAVEFIIDKINYSGSIKHSI